MNKVSLKRKNEDCLEDVAVCPRKRLQLEEIILGDVSTEKDEPIPFHRKTVAAKRRHKLLTSIHLQKRYKYFCKKHNAAYLVESKRKEIKQLAKKKRDSLVQSFRSLKVDLESTSEINSILAPIENKDLNANDSEHHDTKLEETNDKKPESPKRLIKRKFFQKQYDDEDSEESELKKVKLKFKSYDFFNEKFKANRNRYDEDSDYETDCQNPRRRKPKVVKCLIIKKVVGNDNIVYTEGGEFNISDTDDNSECDCQFHDNLNKKCHCCEFELSSSSDDSYDDLNYFFT